MVLLDYLEALANRLDETGRIATADVITGLMKKYAAGFSSKYNKMNKTAGIDDFDPDSDSFDDEAIYGPEEFAPQFQRRIPDEVSELMEEEPYADNSGRLGKVLRYQDPLVMRAYMAWAQVNNPGLYNLLLDAFSANSSKLGREVLGPYAIETEGGISKEPFKSKKNRRGLIETPGLASVNEEGANNFFNRLLNDKYLRLTYRGHYLSGDRDRDIFRGPEGKPTVKPTDELIYKGTNFGKEHYPSDWVVDKHMDKILSPIYGEMASERARKRELEGKSAIAEPDYGGLATVKPYDLVNLQYVLSHPEVLDEAKEKLAEEFPHATRGQIEQWAVAQVLYGGFTNPITGEKEGVRKTTYTSDYADLGVTPRQYEGEKPTRWTHYPSHGPNLEKMFGTNWRSDLNLPARKRK